MSHQLASPKQLWVNTSYPTTMAPGRCSRARTRLFTLNSRVHVAQRPKNAHSDVSLNLAIITNRRLCSPARRRLFVCLIHRTRTAPELKSITKRQSESHTSPAWRLEIAAHSEESTQLSHITHHHQPVVVAEVFALWRRVCVRVRVSVCANCKRWRVFS